VQRARSKEELLILFIEVVFTRFYAIAAEGFAARKLGELRAWGARALGHARRRAVPELRADDDCSRDVPSRVPVQPVSFCHF
jgi:hypothetical protein